jgi:hypothetical protein
MRPDSAARAEFLAAFREIVARIARTLEAAPPASLPVRMYVAGGVALHLYTGVRVTEDIDGVFSRRIALPADLEVAYRDPDGAARLLYFDRQYNDTFGLLHEDAYDDSIALTLDGIDARVLDVRLLSPVDLAVSKIARLSDQDRRDIVALVERGLVDPEKLRERANEAASAYVGDVARLRTSIDLAFGSAVEAARGRTAPRPKR